MSNETEPAVKIQSADGVGWISLNRPTAINAINDAIRMGVPAALAAMDDDDTIRVIVVQGNGPRGFCAGADIKENKPVEGPVAARRRLSRSPWIESFDRVSKPVIASIHGYCFGGGLEIALACDLRIASADARFALPETGLGLIPGGGGTQRLPRLVGLPKALDMLITGDRIDAAEALRYGLITRIVADRDSLERETAELAKRIAARPAVATRYAKEAARASLNVSLRDGFRVERDLFSLLLSTEERLAAAAAFRNRPSGKESE
jgi:enoyl-CoA hydratase/carnithine racemase